jgi:hypothetical protein
VTFVGTTQKKMAAFQAALGATTINPTGTTLTINDASNYTTNTEQTTHGLSHFDLFYGIVVTDFNNVQSVFGTAAFNGYLTTGATILPPSTSTLQTNYTIPLSWDAVYTIDLYTVPTYNNSGTYSVGECVWLASTSSLYICIQASTGNAPNSSPGYWTAITALTGLPAKYHTTQKYVSDYNTQNCRKQKVLTASTCTSCGTGCNNTCMCIAMTLTTKLDAIAYCVTVSDYTTINAILVSTQKDCTCGCT